MEFFLKKTIKAPKKHFSVDRVLSHVLARKLVL